ncbi:hypothetical protein E7742_11380 [Rhodococcus sp. SGAir0479]|nr:hypothetical protein [Rhodococcus sp. SGAir0479]QCQ91771.1 hypothetical protein E7742_11380 [Rhodococcus sp. SGAir0479]
MSRAISQAEEAEVTGKVAAGNDVLGKAELGSRFKTSNSNNVQTSRKAIVQTLFNELYDDASIEYAIKVSKVAPRPASNVDSAIKPVGRYGAVPASVFTRGTLIEVEVSLDVDPVFKLRTMMSEIEAMAKESGELFGSAGQAMLREVGPMNQFIERLLAGLIPIRAKATSLSVIEVDGQEYIVDNRIIDQIDVVRRPLEVVGVTEHIGYWKDIRRVLFSSSRVKVLCRVARDGIHHRWTPVKLAHLFNDVSPELADQINEAGRTGISGLRDSGASADIGVLQQALRFYRQELEKVADVELDGKDRDELDVELQGLSSDGSTSSVQRQAFATVYRAVAAKSGKEELLNPDADLAARNFARASAGLSLSPAFGSRVEIATHETERSSEADSRLLDVEFVAIYW